MPRQRPGGAVEEGRAQLPGLALVEVCEHPRQRRVRLRRRAPAAAVQVGRDGRRLRQGQRQSQAPDLGPGPPSRPLFGVLLHGGGLPGPAHHGDRSPAGPASGRHSLTTKRPSRAAIRSPRRPGGRSADRSPTVARGIVRRHSVAPTLERSANRRDCVIRGAPASTPGRDAGRRWGSARGPVPAGRSSASRPRAAVATAEGSAGEGVQQPSCLLGRDGRSASHPPPGSTAGSDRRPWSRPSGACRSGGPG